MPLHRLLAVCAGLAFTALAAQAQAPPAEVEQRVREFEKAVAEIEKKAQADIQQRRDALVAELTKLQADFTKAGKTADAKAVADQLAKLTTKQLPVQSDPISLTGYRDKVGQVFYFKVRGTRSGSVYGDTVYTDDSTLATAAVHAGALKDGETGVVKVTIEKGMPNYPSVERNGITSRMWGSWVGSFRVEPTKPAPR